MVDHDHRAVVEIGDALVVLLALFQDEYTHCLAREDDRLHGIGKFVDIQHLDAAKLRNLVEVKIVGHDHRIELLAKFDQLQVDLFYIRKVGLDYLHIELRVVSQPLEHVEPAASTLPF